MASLAATHPLATHGRGGVIRPPRPARLASMRPHDARGRDTLGSCIRIRRTNNVFGPSDGARRGVSVVPEASKGYGFGYGYGYGFKYGHGYGEPELGDEARPSCPRPPPRRPPRPHGGGRIQGVVGQGWQDRQEHHRRAGGAALLSYGLISNVFYVSSLLGAMYTSCKVHALSPLVSFIFIFVYHMGN